MNTNISRHLRPVDVAVAVGDSNAQPEVESLGGGDDEVSLLIAVRGPLEQVETLEVVAGLEHLLRRPAQLVPPRPVPRPEPQRERLHLQLEGRVR